VVKNIKSVVVNKMKKYYQLLINIDDSKFEQMPKKKILSEENIMQMHKNLWSMFKLKYSVDEMMEFKKSGVEPFGMNVSDYAWTESVKNDFYNHPYHCKLVKALKKDKGLSWGLWTLNSEPCDFCEIKITK
jgi:hypothetical protein